MEIIGWTRTLNDRLSELMAIYRAGTGTRAAWRLHVEGWKPEAVRDELLADGLTGGEGWAESRMRFISAHDRAALIWSYWWGLPSVRVAWNRVRERAVGSTDYVSWVCNRMHSNATIGMLGA